jgi:hypothetical protein
LNPPLNQQHHHLLNQRLLPQHLKNQLPKKNQKRAKRKNQNVEPSSSSFISHLSGDVQPVNAH